MKEISISKRDLQIKHHIDKVSINGLAKEYNVSAIALKEAMRKEGIQVKNYKEEKVEEELNKIIITE